MNAALTRRPVVLCVFDGWGYRPETDDNAIALAATPAFDRLMSSCPNALLETCGTEVGLPGGQMGNSEVGHLNLGAGRIVDQGAKLVGRAIASGDLDPISQANTHFNRGSLYAKLDNLVGAANDFTRAVQLRPDFALGHRSLAVVHAFAGRDIKALAAFGRSLHLNPEDAVAFNDRGTIYYKLGQLDEAVFDFTQALRLEPAYASAYYNRAATWEELGVPERAADDYRALLIIDPNDIVARADLKRLGLGP